MSMCLAFTKAGKPCRNLGQVFNSSESEVIYSCTCVQHRNYFTEHLEDWKSRIGHYAMWNKAAKYQFEMLLKTKQVILTKDDTLIQENTYIRYYTMYAKYVDGFRMNWNKENFEFAVIRQILSWYPDYEGLLAFAHCSNYETIMKIITREFKKMKKDGNGNVPRVEYEIDSWLQYALEKDKELLNDSKTCEKIQKMLKDCIGPIQEAKFLSYINKFRRAEMKEKKEALSRCKEELIAVTWHPSRVMKWCLDVEEQKEWASFEKNSCSNCS